MLFSCGSTKCSYIIHFSIGPYFQPFFDEVHKEAPYFVCSFEESYSSTIFFLFRDLVSFHSAAGQLTVRWTGIICEVITPHRQDQAWSSPLYCSSKTKLENSVSKLNSHTGLELCVGSSHPKAISEMTKPPFKTMKISGTSWATFKLCYKKGCMM